MVKWMLLRVSIPYLRVTHRLHSPAWYPRIAVSIPYLRVTHRFLHLQGQQLLRVSIPYLRVTHPEELLNWAVQ